MKIYLNIGSDEVTIITEDGGLACIREAEAISNVGDKDYEPRVATSDYYQRRIPNTPDELKEFSECEDIWEYLAEGKMYYDDWPTQAFNSWEAIHTALQWLAPHEENYEFVSELFTEIFDG